MNEDDNKKKNRVDVARYPGCRIIKSDYLEFYQDTKNGWERMSHPSS